MRRRGCAGALLGVVALLAVVPACTSGATRVDTGAVERGIRRSLERHGPGLRLGAVSCPRGVERGDQFTCRARVDGEVLEYSALARRSDGRVTMRARAALIDVGRTEALVARSTVQQSQGVGMVAVDCGPRRFVVEEPGASFRCAVSAPNGQQTEATVRVRDLAGDVELVAT